MPPVAQPVEELYSWLKTATQSRIALATAGNFGDTNGVEAIRARSGRITV